MVEKSLYEYIDIFGKDDFYIELQANGLKEQEILNDDLFKKINVLTMNNVGGNPIYSLNAKGRYLYKKST